MAVYINNKHPKVKLPKKHLMELAEEVLKGEDARGDVSVVLVDDATISELNQKYHRRRGTTDVLSFPFDHQELLGDIFISLDTARRQAREYGHNLTREVRLLLIHGILHLCGYDDQDEESKRRMRARENFYLK